MLDHRDELSQTLVELYQEEPIERDTGVEQQHERIARDERDDAAAQRNTVVESSLVLEQRALSEPAAGWNGDEAYGFAFG